MSGLDNLNNRLNYRGGIKQQDRLISGKLEALKRALLYSYQASTAILADGREFRCLINPDKLKINYDDKIISYSENQLKCVYLLKQRMIICNINKLNFYYMQRFCY